VLSKGLSFFWLWWPFQQGRTQIPCVHPKELISPALENGLEANDGSIPPTTTTNQKPKTSNHGERGIRISADIRKTASHACSAFEGGCVAQTFGFKVIFTFLSLHNVAMSPSLSVLVTRP
jgi:hypothetical protein